MESLSLFKVVMMLWKVCPPAILLLGTFGNVMTLVILRHMDFMSTYFVALAVSDLLFLYTNPLESFLWNVFDIDVLASNEVTVVVVTVLLMALCAHLLAVFTIQRTQEDDNTTSSLCTFNDDEDLAYYDEIVFNWIDLLFSSCIPVVLLFVGNTVLVLTVVRSTHRARRLSAGQRNSQAKREKTASSLTLTLIGVSVTYLVLTLPVCVVSLVTFNVDWANQDVHFRARFELLWTVSVIMWYSNSAVNFYIYCLTGAKFRKKCLRLLCCCIARATR
ncbi:uncharacterized protein [Littorina saxatilis]|uniref:uncharacterized protein n=1 Tax=Littorina saxatilis TaxID=31220 RepID=UPI0038B41DC5